MEKIGNIVVSELGLESSSQDWKGPSTLNHLVYLVFLLSFIFQYIRILS